MEVETYRYLFSALIQVFGTIIAVNAIFLILKYESSQKKLDRARKKMLIGILCYEWTQSVVNYQDVDLVARLESTASQLTRTYSEEDLGKKLDSTRKNIISSIKALKKELTRGDVRKEWLVKTEQQIKYRESALADIQENQLQYLFNKHIIESFFPLVIKTMLVPVILSVVHSLGLLFADVLASCGKLLVTASFAVALSAIGFGLIIYWAASTFKSKYSTYSLKFDTKAVSR